MELRELRRKLVHQHAAHDQQAKHYTDIVVTIPKDAPETGETVAVRAAWLGHAMAASYSYGLASALRLMAEHVSPEVADGIATEVDRILADGDAFDDAEQP